MSDLWFTLILDAQYKGKLCDLKVWSNFIGYGFNLHAEKGNPSHIIGKVDPRSPAEATGMTEGDRILEVNGINVLDESHPDVVKMIKSDPRKVSLLLVSEDCESYMRENGYSQLKLKRMVDISHNICPDVSLFINPGRTSIILCPLLKKKNKIRKRRGRKGGGGVKPSFFFYSIFYTDC